MANVSTLTVSLVADTAKFSNGLKRARKQGKSFGFAMKRAMGGAAIATGVLTTALIGLTKQGLKVADQQKKMADRLGLTQTALAGLTLAGEQTGITFRNFQLGLQRSTRRISEAAKGSGVAVKALDELGLSAETLAALSPDEQFIRLSGAFKEVKTQSDRVRLAFKLFDSEGVGLVNTLRQGEDALRGYIERTKELGVALTDNQLKVIEEANDATNLLKTAFQGLGNQLAAQFAPAIKRAADRVTSIVERVTQAIPTFAAWTRSIFGVQRALDTLTIKDLTAEIAEIDKDLFEAQNRLAARLERGVIGGRNRLGSTKEIDKLKAEIKSLTDRYNAAIRQRLKLRKEGEFTPGAGTDAITGSESGGSDDTFTRRLKGSLAKFRFTQRELQENMNMFDEWERRALAATAATATPFEAFRDRMLEIRKDLIENPFYDEELARREASAATDAYLEEMRRMRDESNATVEEIREFQRAAFQNMQGILAEFLFEPFEEGLDGMLKSFIEMLRKMVAQLLAQKILTAFFKRFGLSIPGVQSSSSGRAIGGPVAAGVSYKVNERGPEMFTPGASGSIRPIGMLQFNNETNINTGGGNFSEAALVPILEENNRALEARILDKMDRGSYS